MPKRKNRHIGREMEYPYSAPPPDKQVAYIFDTNKCIACQTCTLACKTCWTSGKGQEHIFWNNVETTPYGGYPQGWHINTLEKMEPAKWEGNKLTSKTIFEGNHKLDPPKGWLPKADDYSAPNLGEDDITGEVKLGHHFEGEHPMWMFYMARICNHCDNPACLAACPRKAIYKREQDGIVLIDQKRCRGYQECVAACPYKKTFFNMISRASEKCIGCFPRVEKGLVALCVESCIGKIRQHGFLTTKAAPRADNPLDYIIKIKKIALPLFPQFGTGPNVYYIPPVHVPNTFLEQMFGPGVAEAKKAYRNLKNDKQLLGALLLSGASPEIITKFQVRGNEVLGWNQKGEQVAKVPFTEPSWIRQALDRKHGATRHNTT